MTKMCAVNAVVPIHHKEDATRTVGRAWRRYQSAGDGPEIDNITENQPTATTLAEAPQSTVGLMSD